MKDEKVTYIILGILTAFVAFTLLGGDIYDNGNGTDEVRNKLEQAGIYQQEQSRTIEEAETTAERIADGEQNATAIIADGKRILAEVRARGENGTPTP